MTPLELALSIARAVQLAAVLSVFGAFVFRTIVAPFAVWRVVRPSLVLVVASAVVWLTLQAAELADAQSIGEAAAALPVALFATRFGHSLLARLALIALAVAAAVTAPAMQVAGASPGRGRAAIAAVLAGGCAAVQVMVGHAGASGDPVWIAVAAAHILAAGAWLGGLVPLQLALGTAPDGDAGRVARRFSPLGFVCVLVIVATAYWQARLLIGGIAGLLGTNYGETALVKLGLLGLLLGFAAMHRWVLVSALRDASGRGLFMLRRSLLAETMVGLCVVVAAGKLASLAPGAHEQPDWPFAWRPSLVALSDPEIRHEVAAAILAIGLATMLVMVAIGIRRLRWAPLAGAVVIGWLAAPHLRPLLIEAYPTSFYVSPTGFDAGSIVAGEALFGPNCARCHGTDGRGDGPDAKGLAISPADLTADHLWDHSDGELFWWLTHGMESPEGGLSMPGFAATLDSDARWALIDYIRAHNAGVARRSLGAWFRPTPAPGFDAVCGDGSGASLEALRGHPVRIVVGPPDGALVGEDGGSQHGMVTVFLTPTDPPATGGCVAQAPEVTEAYAVETGVARDKLSGTWFLVDPQGWLRAVHRLDESGPARLTLAAEINSMLAHPIAATSGGVHVHHH